MDVVGKCTDDDVADMLPLRHLSCPICEEPFLDTILQCPEGHAYCRRCWKRWLKDGRGSCPECRTHVVFSRLVRNRQVEHLITELREREQHMRRTSSDEIRARGGKNTEAAGNSHPRNSAAHSSSSSASLPSSAAPLTSPRSSSPSVTSSGLYILSDSSHRRTEPDAVAAAIPQNNFTNRPRAPLPQPGIKHKSVVLRLLKLAILLIVVYRTITMVPLLLQLYFSGFVPSFTTLCGELEKLCTVHWANMSPSEHENTRELLREMLLAHSSHLPLLYVMKELYLHVALFFQRILLVSFCITDVMLLLSVWFSHRTMWLFYRLALSGVLHLYNVAHRILIDPSGPQVLWGFLAFVRMLLVGVARLGLHAAYLVRELFDLAVNTLR